MLSLVYGLLLDLCPVERGNADFGASLYEIEMACKLQYDRVLLRKYRVRFQVFGDVELLSEFDVAAEKVSRSSAPQQIANLHIAEATGDGVLSVCARADFGAIPDRLFGVVKQSV